MNDHEIMTAALKWHTIYTKRLTIGKENAKRLKAERADYQDGHPRYFGPCPGETAPLLTAIKRKELAALRELARVCAKVRGHQREVDDARQVVDVEVKLLEG
ncbi:MAG: hypothetical protein WAV85_16035 [Rhodoferax sp.]